MNWGVLLVLFGAGSLWYMWRLGKDMADAIKAKRSSVINTRWVATGIVLWAVTCAGLGILFGDFLK